MIFRCHYITFNFNRYPSEDTWQRKAAFPKFNGPEWSPCITWGRWWWWWWWWWWCWGGVHSWNLFWVYFFFLSSSSSIGTSAHCGLWPVEQDPSIFSYLPPTLSIFSLPALEDLLLLPLSIFSWVFPLFSPLPFLDWRSFWASYPSPFSLGDLTSLSFALLSILLYFLHCSSILVLDSSDFSIPRFHI